MLDNIFTYILDMTMAGSLVIMAVLLGRLALRRMPKIFSYCLWAVVLLRLLCPVGITIPIETEAVLPSVSQSYTLDQVDLTLQEEGMAAITGLYYVTNFNPDTYEVTIPQKPVNMATTMTAVTCSPWETWVLLGQYLWVAGALAVGGVSLIRFLRLRRQLSEAVCLEKGVYVIDGIGTPFVLGLLRPRIYLPSLLTEQQRELIVHHELRHIRRLDHIWKALGFVALCLHWFNPLVWLAFRLATQDMEMSCDEAVAQKLSKEERADYAQALLCFSAGGILRSAPAFGQGDTGKRIRNLRQWKQPRRWLSLMVAVCCVMLMVGCMVDGTENVGDAAHNSIGENTQPVNPPEAELLFDVKNKPENEPEEVYFQLPEYPDVQFCRRGAAIYMQVAGQLHQICIGYQIYIADLNGDGKREFLSSISFGSGILDYRIYVYDVADDMAYCMHQRAYKDFGISIEDGKLVVLRYEHMGIHNNQEALNEGTLLIENRMLYFVCEDWRVAGVVESEHFGPQWWEAACTKIQDYISRDMHFAIYYNDATNYYLEKHMDVIGPAVLEEEEIRFFVDSGLMVENADTLQYLELINRITSPYRLYGVSARYVYRDPNQPAQLFICTELRDTGYRDIQSYYEALIAGKCRPHAETYILRLDCNAIYRWGENENLYIPIP